MKNVCSLQFISKVVVKERKGGNYEVVCILIYCDHKITGTISRIRDHFAGSVGCGVKISTKISSIHEIHLNALNDEIQQARIQSESRAKKRKMDACT